MSPVCRIFLQQQLSGKSKDVANRIIIWTKCWTPLFWNEPGENQVFGPEILWEVERQVQVIRQNLKLAQSRQKSYADHRRRNLSFQVGDFVYLKVSPMRGLHHFKIRGKLAPRYIGSFKILKQRGEVEYQLELPPQLSDMHDIFRVSQLRKCLWVSEEQMPLEELTIGEDLTYQEYLVKILDTLDKVNRNNRYKMCKVQWSNHTEEEVTWKKKISWRQSSPISFPIGPNFLGKMHPKGGRYVTL
jgi:hypothetical protein